MGIDKAAACVALVGVLVVGGSAHAADQGLTGKKLLLKGGKVVLLSKDASLDIAGSDPVNGADSSLSFDDGSGPVTFSLPRTLWSTNGSVTLFKYKNTSAPGGPSVVKIAKVKPGLLKIVAEGVPFAVPSGSATIAVVLSIDGGNDRYCMTFGGTGNGSKFLVKDTGPGTCSADTPTATPTDAPTVTPTQPPTSTPTSTLTATPEPSTATETETPTTIPSDTATASPTATTTPELLPENVVIDINFPDDPQVAVIPPADVSQCPRQDPDNGGCAINELDGTIDNTFDASNSVDPNANPGQDEVQYHWQIFYPSIFGSQVLYSSAGISGYHSPVLHIVPGSLPQLDGDPRVGSDIFWRVELTVTVTTPQGTLGTVKFFRFAYSSDFSLQISSSCQLTGQFMGVDCSMICPQLLPTTEDT